MYLVRRQNAVLSPVGPRNPRGAVRNRRLSPFSIAAALIYQPSIARILEASPKKLLPKKHLNSLLNS